MNYIPKFLQTQAGNTCVITIAGLVSLADLLWKFHNDPRPEFQGFGIAATTIIGVMAWHKQKDIENDTKNNN